MELKDKNIVFGITGSFYTFKNTILQVKELVKEKVNIIPIMSYAAYNIDTKFGNAKYHIKEIEEITGNKIIHTIKDVEQLLLRNINDIMIIAPCTGNTIAKLSNGICDSPVLLASKLNFKRNNPLVIAPSTSDGLSTSAENIGRLLNRKDIFFVPFRQDNPITKPRSISFDPKYIKNTLKYALDREQIQPILL